MRYGKAQYLQPTRIATEKLTVFRCELPPTAQITHQRPLSQGVPAGNGPTPHPSPPHTPIECSSIPDSANPAGSAPCPSFVVKPPNLCPISKSNKANHIHRKKAWPALQVILPQKRTIEAVVQRTNFMHEAIRKIAESLVPQSPPDPRVKCAKRRKKVRENAQKRPGNQPAKHSASTT